MKLIFGSTVQTPESNYRKIIVSNDHIIGAWLCVYIHNIRNSIQGLNISEWAHVEKQAMLQPLGEENNFDLYSYNVRRLPYLRADLAQKIYALGMSKTKVRHCIYRIRLTAILCAYFIRSWNLCTPITRQSTTENYNFHSYAHYTTAHQSNVFLTGTHWLLVIIF